MKRKRKGAKIGLPTKVKEGCKLRQKRPATKVKKGQKEGSEKRRGGQAKQGKKEEAKGWINGV